MTNTASQYKLFMTTVRKRGILSAGFYSLRWTLGGQDGYQSTTQVVSPNAERG
jgi:hypothetical protein